jgi:hypothetical protein
VVSGARAPLAQCEVGVFFFFFFFFFFFGLWHLTAWPRTGSLGVSLMPVMVIMALWVVASACFWDTTHADDLCKYQLGVFIIHIKITIRYHLGWDANPMAGLLAIGGAAGGSFALPNKYTV